MGEKGNENTAQGIDYILIPFSVIYSVYSCRGLEIFMTVECKYIILSIFEISLSVDIYSETNLACLHCPANVSYGFYFFRYFEMYM